GRHDDVEGTAFRYIFYEAIKDKKFIKENAIMPLESSDYFRITRMAYTTGLTGKITSISEQALEAVFQELGIGPYEMFDCLDRTDPDPVEKILGRIPAFLVRLTARPILMKLTVLALNRPFIRARVLKVVKGKFHKFFEDAMKNAARPGEVTG
ncbi:MAG: hypothetical protein ACOZBW_04035, partial [Thermodesulfobacteriota bacterium]